MKQSFIKFCFAAVVAMFFISCEKEITETPTKPDIPTVNVPFDEIWYTSSDGQIVTPKDSFNVTIISNTYTDGKGIIKFDEDLTQIGNQAFMACNNLSSINIPNSIKSIGKSAFRFCGQLKSMNIPQGVTSIAEGTFFECGLETITIPDSVTSIGYESFFACSKLTSITIPQSVTTIESRAFVNCRNLASIIIPKSVTSIGSDVFSVCYNLVSMKVESGNMTYDSRSNCNAIIETATNTLLSGCKNTIIPNSVTSIGCYAFFGCSTLTSITIPNSVISIGDGAFANCKFMLNEFINNSSLNEEAHEYWGATIYDIIQQDGLCITKNVAMSFRGLPTNINIPTSVTKIGYQAFLYCRSLKSISIPSSVTKIEAFAFESCENLTSITIPKTVSNIEDFAFRGCSNLTSFYVCWNIPLNISAITEIFDNEMLNKATLYVPKGSRFRYVNASVWKDFGKIVEWDPTAIEEINDYVNGQ